MAVLMKDVAAKLKSVIEKNNLKYKYDEEQQYFSLGFALAETKLSGVEIIIQLMPDMEDQSLCSHIVSHGLVVLKVGEGDKNDVAEFLHRVNYRTIFGCFEFDFDEGEIRYRLTLNCHASMPEQDDFEDLWNSPAYMFERYGNGIIAVCKKLATPKEIYEYIVGN